MIYQQLKLLVLMVFGFILVLPVQADNLGTLFTSFEDRKRLEKIRSKKDVNKPKVIIEKIEEPAVIPDVEKEVVLREPIALRGIVHRSSGKSTAWVNDGNTFEGNLDSEFIDVPSDKIKPDKITIIMSDDNSEVNLKVGEVYTPAPIERDAVNIIVPE